MNEQPKRQIGICIHGTENVPTQVYFNHIEVIAGWNKAYPLGLFGLSRIKVAKARNMLTKLADEANCSHVLFLDTDHMIDSSMLPKLMENADAGMVSGLVCKRGYPYICVGFCRHPDGSGRLHQIVLEPNTGVHKVDGCAFGCTLINMDCLRKLPKPWFYDTVDRRSDLNLCDAMRKADFEVLLDTRVEVGHLGDVPIIWPGISESLRKHELEETHRVMKEQDNAESRD